MWARSDRGGCPEQEEAPNAAGKGLVRCNSHRPSCTKQPPCPPSCWHQHQDKGDVLYQILTNLPRARHPAGGGSRAPRPHLPPPSPPGRLREHAARPGTGGSRLHEYVSGLFLPLLHRRFSLGRVLNPRPPIFLSHPSPPPSLSSSTSRDQRLTTCAANTHTTHTAPPSISNAMVPPARLGHGDTASKSGRA